MGANGFERLRRADLLIRRNQTTTAVELDQQLLHPEVMQVAPAATNKQRQLQLKVTIAQLLKT